MRINLKNVRLAFPALFEAKTVNGEGEPRYSAVFLLPPTHPQLPALRKALKDVAKEKWSEKADSIYAQMEKKLNICLHEGDEKADYEGFPGNFFISTGNKIRPPVFDRDRSPLTIADGRPYSGCYVNAVIDLWAQDNKFGKRINASLGGVQFFKDGDAFAGGTVASANDFDDLSVEDEEESLV